jgi:hypothetical protein
LKEGLPLCPAKLCELEISSGLLSLLVQPLIGAGLARMAFPEENLAAC